MLLHIKTIHLSLHWNTEFKMVEANKHELIKQIVTQNCCLIYVQLNKYWMMISGPTFFSFNWWSACKNTAIFNHKLDFICKNVIESEMQRMLLLVHKKVFDKVAGAKEWVILAKHNICFNLNFSLQSWKAIISSSFTTTYNGNGQISFKQTVVEYDEGTCIF